MANTNHSRSPLVCTEQFELPCLDYSGCYSTKRHLCDGEAFCADSSDEGDCGQPLYKNPGLWVGAVVGLIIILDCVYNGPLRKKIKNYFDNCKCKGNDRKNRRAAETRRTRCHSIEEGGVLLTSDPRATPCKPREGGGAVTCPEMESPYSTIDSSQYTSQRRESKVPSVLINHHSPANPYPGTLDEGHRYGTSHGWRLEVEEDGLNPHDPAPHDKIKQPTAPPSYNKTVNDGEKYDVPASVRTGKT